MVNSNSSKARKLLSAAWVNKLLLLLLLLLLIEIKGQKRAIKRYVSISVL